MLSRILAYALLATGALLAAPVHAAETPAGNITVTYEHPDQFTEARKLRALAPSRLDDGYLATLKTFIETRAGRMLPPGDHLAITVTDIDRAGSFEPWLGPRLQDVRIIKDIYPPRIDLHFRLTNGEGKLVREGTRKLRDPGFMYDTATRFGSGNLRYEKALLDRWLAKGPDKL
ncbi:MAG: DUF3016 domain-containing protein [Rhodanobacter sp.]|nr:MAG: DUF3016 domain-containing protein [Rhodanobacter sp.]TAM15111.1 MAG: DUF3016 domain-containing protein [Rhodanobacter sp.]TAM36419.1 MAG: DUF3016 domain-containing protein [Rhodanobacter sp.]